MLVVAGASFSVGRQLLAWKSVALEEIGGDDWDCAPRQGWASKKLGGGLESIPLSLTRLRNRVWAFFIGSTTQSVVWKSSTAQS